MAYFAVANLVEKVVNPRSSNRNIDAEDDLDQLENDLRYLKDTIEDAPKMAKISDAWEQFDREIMEFAYDTENFIDSSLIASTKSSIRQRPITKALVKSAQHRVNMLIDRARDLHMMGRSGGDEDDCRRDRRETQTSKVENIIGFEHEEKKIMGYLLQEEYEIDVIAIIGMAGLGKTTLAWRIYGNPETYVKFPFRFWIYASETFNLRDVLLKILKFYTSEDMSARDNEALVDWVHGYLQKSRFLLVIDDLCSAGWKAIRNVLPKTSRGSRVLITSRFSNVGLHASPYKEHIRLEHIRLGFLTKDQSWELLQYEVFRPSSDCPRELMGIGEYIAKQCEGLPLLITDIGGVLSEKLSSRKEMSETMDEWNMVSENIPKFLTWNSLDFVASSYDRLPTYLKFCFLYLGVFPVDYEIPVWTLINLWIAEGLVLRVPGRSLEEIAAENLMELVNRNLVKVDKTNSIGEAKTCRVHVLIHTFCRSKAEKLNLFQEIKMSMEGTFEPPVSDVQMYHRVCVHSDLLEFLSRKPRFKNLRSFLCFYKEPLTLGSEHISTMDDAFSLLRVLATNHIKFTQFPKWVTKLTLLTYVTLCGDDLEIPEAISRLQYLQTIVVDTESQYLTVKANIFTMIALKHIKTKAAIVLDNKEKEGNAARHGNLQTLSRISPKSCSLYLLDRAPNLQKLGFRGDLTTLELRSLRELDRLQYLKVLNDPEYIPSSRGLGYLPAYLPVNLKSLTLSGTYINWEDMFTLGAIHSLQVLKLKNYAFIGEWWINRGGLFSSLQFLLIDSSDLILWEVSADDFPELVCLVLNNCEKLCEIPMNLSKSLKKLDIENVSVSAVESAKAIKEMVSGLELSIGPGCE